MLENETGFLEEVMQASSPYRNDPEFMSQRCQIALEQLKPKILKGGQLSEHDFVAVLPLYQDDFEQVPFLRRPSVTDVSSPQFQDLVHEIAREGFSCFIDRPGLTAFKSVSMVNPPPEIELRDFGMVNLSAHRKVQWALYVLLPQRKSPRFSLWRYFTYGQEMSDYDLYRLIMMCVVIPFMALSLGILSVRLLNQFFPEQGTIFLEETEK